MALCFLRIRRSTFPSGSISKITFKTFAPTCKNAVDALRWVNHANERLEHVQFHFAQAKVWGYHWMTYVDGLSIRQLITTLRCFSAGFREGIMIEPEHA